MNFGWKICSPITLINLRDGGLCIMAHPWCRVRWRLTYVFDYGKTRLRVLAQSAHLIMVASHATNKRDTILYPEQPVPVPPRFRGRIVLTRDGWG